MINHYKTFIQHFLHYLASLVHIMAKNVCFQWTKTEQDAFDLLKQSLSREVCLAYPDFSRPFIIYMDTSTFQLGGVIMQPPRILAFYSHKLLLAQT